MRKKCKDPIEVSLNCIPIRIHYWLAAFTVLFNDMYLLGIFTVTPITPETVVIFAAMISYQLILRIFKIRL